VISEVMEEVRRLSVAGSFVNERWQALEGLPNRRGEVPTGEFNRCVGISILFTKADIHAGLTHVVWFPRIGAGQRDTQAGLPDDPCRMLDTDFCEFTFHALG
jgi:hypothetical protein